VKFESDDVPTLCVYPSRCLSKNEVMACQGSVVHVSHTRPSQRGTQFHSCHATCIMDASMIPKGWMEEYQKQALGHTNTFVDVAGLLSSLGGGWTSSEWPSPAKSLPPPSEARSASPAGDFPPVSSLEGLAHGSARLMPPVVSAQDHLLQEHVVPSAVSMSRDLVSATTTSRSCAPMLLQRRFQKSARRNTLFRGT